MTYVLTFLGGVLAGILATIGYAVVRVGTLWDPPEPPLNLDRLGRG